MDIRQLVSAFFVTGLASASCFLYAGKAAAADDQYTKAAHNYDTYCVQCHGVNRNGKGLNTRDMPVQPRDHSDPKGMGDIPDDELHKAIKEGGLAVNKSVLMPAWGNVLTDEEIQEMVAYLRHVCQCGPSK
ncbi:MAG: cytochrome c [Rugosibacter sp.]|nr:MAG: cytochrome c [Rugosibacter sp.]